jgi:5,10-methylenetetrahydrofolate reductase
VLRDRLCNRKVLTLELLLPIEASADRLLKELEPFKDLVDAVNIPSNPLGKLHPDSSCFGHIVQEKLDLDPIPHFVARHYTLLGFESKLLGVAALGIGNILCVTGDTPIEGRSIFELNSTRLLDIASSLKKGLTSSRKAIKPLDFCLCTCFNPNVPHLQGELIKAGEKLKSGAEVFFTQPVFDPDRFITALKELRQRCRGIRIIAGLSFLFTKKRAFALTKFLGIPYEYIGFVEDRDETDMLYNTALKIRDHVDGYYIISIGKYEKAVPLVRKLKKLID